MWPQKSHQTLIQLLVDAPELIIPGQMICREPEARQHEHQQ
jgi:hypothetical protein